MAEPLLTIDAIEPDRDTVSLKWRHPETNEAIHGLYHIKAVEELGLRDQAKVRRIWREIEYLQGLDEDAVTEADADLLSRNLKEFVGTIMLDLPPEALAVLEDRHLQPMMQAFGRATGGSQPEPLPQTAPNRRARRTTAKSSPSLTGSTAATRRRG